VALLIQCLRQRSVLFAHWTLTSIGKGLHEVVLPLHPVLYCLEIRDLLLIFSRSEPEVAQDIGSICVGREDSAVARSDSFADEIGFGILA
jgi:hypothetical protein